MSIVKVVIKKSTLFALIFFANSNFFNESQSLSYRSRMNYMTFDYEPLSTDPTDMHWHFEYPNSSLVMLALLLISWDAFTAFATFLLLLQPVLSLRETFTSNTLRNNGQKLKRSLEQALINLGGYQTARLSYGWQSQLCGYAHGCQWVTIAGRYCLFKGKTFSPNWNSITQLGFLHSLKGCICVVQISVVILSALQKLRI